MITFTEEVLNGKWLHEVGWSGSQVGSVSGLSCFLGKFNKFYSFWLHDIFSTSLPGLVVSWKPGSLVSGLNFDYVITHPRIRDRFFFFAYAPHTKTESYQRTWWVDPANELTSQAHWFNPLNEPAYGANPVPGSNRFIKSAPKLQYKLLT